LPVLTLCYPCTDPYTPGQPAVASKSRLAASHIMCCAVSCCAVSCCAVQLVRSGRTVVVAARSADKATEVFTEAGLQEGYQQAADGSDSSSSSSGGSGGILIVEAGVDVTNPETLTPQLFEGVTQVMSSREGVGGKGLQRSKEGG